LWDEAEKIVLKKILKGRKFEHAADIGGGFGRNSSLLQHYAKKVVLIEPSSKLLEISKKYIKKEDGFGRIQATASKIPLKDGELDLAIMMRVMHHLPSPEEELKEVYRVLDKKATFILEVASSSHFKNKLKYLAKFKKIPKEPLEQRSLENIKIGSIPFSSHHPETIEATLKKIGFKIESKYSVSNLRSGILKKVFGKNLLLKIEDQLQKPLAFCNFGPSIVYVLKKD
jgi:ubiquinone/menaquinone biosynthesis C-methylase UbiE